MVCFFLVFISLSKALFSHYITPNNIRVCLQKNKTVKLLIQRKLFVLCYLDYIEDVYQTLLEAMNTTSCLGSAVRELKGLTPLPMNSIPDKETRESALDSRQKRKKMVLKNIRPTTPYEYTRVHMQKNWNVMEFSNFLSPSWKAKYVNNFRIFFPCKINVHSSNGKSVSLEELSLRMSTK